MSNLNRMVGYRFEQTVADTTWTITHNLGTQAPVIDIWVDVAGTMTKIIPQTVAGTSTTVATLTFTTPYAGVAYVA